VNTLEKFFSVTKENSAQIIGSGDLPVLATPALVAMAEQTSKELCESFLEAGETTVGSAIAIEHMRPTGIGKSIKVKVTLESQEQQRLHFSYQAFEDDRLIAKGEHDRVVVDIKRFLERVYPE